MRRSAALLIPMLLALCVARPAAAYYHYTHYLTAKAPYTPVPEKYNLSVLPSSTLTVFISGSGPTTYAANDTFGAVLSQVKQAIGVWNGVDGSALRVAFGGLASTNQVYNTPAVQVEFTDLGPGVLGLTTVIPAAAPNSDNTFFPLTGAVVMLTDDTSASPGPSYLESFFTTTVHELGHALGLQHSYTSSAMSQAVVRNTSRQRPLTQDDRAGLKVLYGTSGWQKTVGSISGTITSGGAGVGMASVVALPPVGPAISTLTNPDGTYQINGLAPGNYYLYVHPLPPDAVELPRDSSGKSIATNIPIFETLFYPGTRNVMTEAQTIMVKAGKAAEGLDFSVGLRDALPVYNVVTYSFLDPVKRVYTSSGSIRTTPAYVDTTQAKGLVVVRAYPPVVTPVPTSVTLLGGFANAKVIPYGSPLALALYFNMPLVPGSGTRHLIMNFDSDLYVLPDAVDLVGQAPPQVDTVASNDDGTVSLTGQGLSASTKIYLDGLPASQAAAFVGDSAEGTIKITPPVGASGQVATIVAENADEQNSMLLQFAAPPTYTYPASDAPTFSMSPVDLPVDSSSLIEITASNASLTAGHVTLGLGTPDVTVNQLWVLNAEKALANVTVSASAATGFSEVSLISGFRSASQANGFGILAAEPKIPNTSVPVVNSDTAQAAVFPGTTLQISGRNLTSGSAAPTVTLDGTALPVLTATTDTVTAAVPASFSPGVSILRLSNSTGSAYPVAVTIAAAPPTVTAVLLMDGSAVTESNPAAAGSTVQIGVRGLASTASDISVTVGGVAATGVSVTRATDSTSAVIQAVLPDSFDAGSADLLVIVDGCSQPATKISVLQTATTTL